MRRPPLVAMGSIASVTVEDTVYNPLDCRVEDFVYSSSLRYLALFTTYRQASPEIVNYGRLDVAQATSVEFPGTTALDFGSADFDIEFDIYCDDWKTGYAIPIHHSLGSPAWTDTFRIAINNGSLLLQTYDAGGAEAQSSCPLPVSGQWHSVKIEKIGTAVTWTIDGEAEATGTAKATLRTTAGAFLHLTHANRTLDIKNLKLTSAASANNLDVPFDDASGTTLDDNSTNGYDGTVTTNGTNFWQSYENPLNADFGRIAIVSTDGVQKAELDIPYTQEEILELDTHHSNDTMWITHQNHPPQTLVRKDDNNWLFEAAKVDGGPFLDRNEDELKSLQTGGSTWSASIEYLVGDQVLAGDVVASTVDWIGSTTSYEAEKAQRIVEGAPLDEWDLGPSGLGGWSYAGTQYKGAGGTNKWAKFYPYLCVRIDVTAGTPAELIVGASIQLNVTLDEGGATFSAEGTVAAVYYGSGNYKYVKLNIGSYYRFDYRTWDTSPPYTYLKLIEYENLPLPDWPEEAAIAAWFDDSSNTTSFYYGSVTPWTHADEGSKKMWVLMGGYPSGPPRGGAQCTQADGLYYGGGVEGVEAIAETTGNNPFGLITAFAAAPSPRASTHTLVTSASHGVVDGESVTIENCLHSAYNAEHTVSSVTTNTYEIEIAYVAETIDGTESWTNTSYWEHMGGLPTGSPIVKVASLGHEPFASDDVGRLIEIEGDPEYSYAGSFTVLDEASDDIYILGDLELSMETSNFTGLLVLEKKTIESADWQIIGSLRMKSGGNVDTITRTIPERNSKIRVRLAEISTGTCHWRVTATSAYTTIYEILEYNSENNVDARVITGRNTFGGTWAWAMGAWGGSYGFPGCITMHENRLWLSGSIGEPFKHWGSVANKYWNFAIGTFVTSAIIFQARADSSTRIAWVEPKGDLFFGTDFGEYSGVNLDQTNVLSATNPPKLERHTSEGSARIPAEVIGNALAFISANKKQLKLLRYDGLEQDGFRSYDMTFMNPDIAGSGFVGHCLQRSPYPVLWLWTADGNAVSFTVDREHNVIAWAEHSTAGGLIKSMCRIPDENGIDEIYAVVKREGTVLSISDPAGTATPNVTGVYSGGSFGMVTISGTGTDSDRILRYSGIWNGKPNYADDNLDYDLYYEGGGYWVYSTLDWTWEIQSESETPPNGIWTARNDPGGLYQSATIIFDAPAEGTGYLFTYDGDDLVYMIVDDSGVEYFESSTGIGTFNPVAGSGATGSVEVGSINYHIEKLDYAETEHTDSLNGAIPQPLTSIFEPTPLSRGPNFLEGNKKFKTARGFIYVVESNGGEISVDGGASWETLDYSRLTADADGLYTGKIEFRSHSGSVDYATVQVRTTGTDPLTVTGISLEVEKGERGIRR